MPSIESVPESQIKHVEKVPDFDALQTEKEKLFREAEEESMQFSEDEKMDAVSTVSNYSVKDGFELARRLGLDGNRTFHAMTYGTVVYKNKPFFTAFDNYLAANEGYADNSNHEKSVMSDGVGRIQRGLDSQLDDVKLYIDHSKRQTGSLGPKIDEYYSHFIRNRRVKSPELPNDGRTQIERVAEEHLLSAQAILEESYYTGPVREFLGLDEKVLGWEENGIHEGYGDKGAQFKRDLQVDDLWKLRGNVIDRQSLDALFETKIMGGLDKNDPRLESVLKNARYAPSKVVFEERKRGAEKGLIKQIEDSMVARGFKKDDFEITLNQEKGEYEVVKKEKEQEEETIEEVENKENMKLVKEIPRDISLSKVDANYQTYRTMEDEEDPRFNQFRIDQGSFGDSGVIMIDGELHTLYKSHYLSSFFVRPDGSKSRMYYHAHSPREVNGKLGFDFAPDATMQSYRMMFDSEVFGDKYWQPRGYDAVEHEGKLFYVAEEKASDSSHSHALFKGASCLRDFGPGVAIDDFFVGQKDIACVTRSLSDNKKREVQFITHNEKLGPYDNIELCKNSKDELIFYAKKGDEHFVYVDGVDEKIEYSGGAISQILLCNEEIYLLCNDAENEELGTSESYLGAGIHLVKGKNSISNFMEINGGIFYLRYFKGRGFHGYPDKVKQFSWQKNGDDRSSDYYLKKINLTGVYNQAVGFHDTLFITDDKKILSLKYGEEKFKEVTFDGYVRLSQSGGKLFILESLEDKERVWEYSEAGEIELKENEKRDLDLANAVAKEDLDTIKEYFAKYYPEEAEKSPAEQIKAGLKGMLEQSGRFVSAVNQTIKEMPELFMDTFRAKDDKPTEYLMTQMFNYMFPETRANKEKALKQENKNNPNRPNIFGGSRKDAAVNYDPGVDRLASVDESGYYEMINANREVLKLREPLPDSTFIVSGIFGNHTEGGWAKVNVPISQEIQEPAKETTFEFVDEKSSQTINLPRIAGSKIITERLKGVNAKDAEVPVKVIEENNLGEVRVDKGKDARRLAYSQSFSEVPKTMAEITEKDYEKFKKDFERSFGDVMTKPIGDLGDELDVFVRGLRDKSPREQVIAIQEFCYEYGYYNVDKQVRDTDSFEERLSIMEGRMEELKEKDPKLARKLYAGICTDFATLTTALLRKAGFVSGISTGYVPESGSTVIKSDRAHAVSYVLWPNPENKDRKPDMIIVDGTPSSMTPKIVEQEKIAKEVHGESGINAEKEMAELERILKTMDSETIKKMENGVLEKTLNQILYGVKQSHVDVMERVLNASRYAGFDIIEMTRGNVQDQIEFRKFLEEEIYKEKGATHENRERRGEELFELMLDFTKRFEKDKDVKNKAEVFDILEKVFDVSEKYLDPIEARSAAAIVTYLRAKKMR